MPLSSVFRRLMFAIRFRSTDTFFSPNLTADSRVMMYRRIARPGASASPRSCTYDPDPYIAITDGRLVWMQDVYTTSSRYPYSTPPARRELHPQRGQGHDRRLSRHDALPPGRPDRSDRADDRRGCSRACSSRSTTMPEDLRTRLRYPQEIFTLQAAMFATYHMLNPAVFYNREDQWEIPSFDVGGQPQPMQPYYTIMKLPGETGPEYIQMLPFTPRQKDNLAAWMVARSDGDHYGKLVVFQFPKQTVIFGPKQVAARISQDQVIAPQITLWNQQGSEVIQGTLLVIPIEESLIYIRPLYLRAAGGLDPRAQARHRRVPEPDRDGGDARRRARPALPRRRRRRAARRRPRRDAGAPAAPRRAPARLTSPRWPAQARDALPARAAGPARGQLGALRRGDQAARRGARADGEAVAPGSLLARRAGFDFFEHVADRGFEADPGAEGVVADRADEGAGSSSGSAATLHRSGRTPSRSRYCSTFDR